MLRNVLLLTVGTGTRADVNIVKPLVKTIKDSAPGFLGLIVSDVSRTYAEEIVKQLGLSNHEFGLLRVSNPDNLEAIYCEIVDWIRSLVNRGYSPGEITVDFTSGTKAMTSGAVLAAVGWGCAGLKYITGKRKNGVVQEGTESFVTVQPNTVLAHREMQIGRRFIEEFRFSSAIAIFSSINRALLSRSEEKLLDGLTNVANAYDCWDRFMQNRVDGYMSKVPGDLEELAPFMVSNEIRHRLVVMYKEMEKGGIPEDLLADVFNNACRRFKEGKYDDATARSYRLVEMLAQMVLAKEFGIQTGDVREDQIPESILDEVSQKRDRTDGKIKIGLQKSFELLKALGDPIGKKFFENKALSAKLKQRNDSFLAHGTRPVSRDACRSLLDEARSLVTSHVSNFDSLCSDLRFPWEKERE